MPGLVVETRYGRIRGSAEDGLSVFRGVPFAAAPVGELRFRPPAEPEPWTGVREATAFSPMSPQPPPTGLEAIPGDPTEQSEDCLYLNVWTPAPDGGGRPVMVFIHGGGFGSGSSSVSVYHGAALARHDVVVVTVNYRLGVLGWLAHPMLARAGAVGEGFGNWGLQDQIAALRFVREHAAAFGGDPENVTVFGESAGAMSVAALLGCAAARPLFNRAILQSGAAAALGVAEGSRVAQALASELGLSSVTRDGLVSQPVEALLAAQQAVASRQDANGLTFQPVVDGGALERHPAVEIALGKAAGIDLMVGTNRDEWALFSFGATAAHEIDDGRLLKLVRRHLRAAGLEDVVPAEEFIETHRAARSKRDEPADPASLYTSLGTDWVFRVPSMRLLAAQATYPARTYAYLFDWETPFGGGGLGSCHALELPFVFGTADNPFISLFAGSGPEADRLAAAMTSAWTAFARTGDPSETDGPVGAWPLYRPPERLTMRLGRVIEVVSAPKEIERSWLDEHLGPYGKLEAAGLDHVREPARGT
jgi:para-nitrobenzyl esterase